MRNHKLDAIFAFLKENRSWSLEFQKRESDRIFRSAANPYDRLTRLLYVIANTQSRPPLNNLQKFWQRVHLQKHIGPRLTMAHLAALFNCSLNPEAPFLSLHDGLYRQPGWGAKTTALFIKNLFHIHASDDKTLHFVHDAPKMARNLSGRDRLYLPVDAVIQHLFKHHIPIGQSPTPKGINRYLHSHIESPHDMLVWDDLWFWGFITQKGDSASRQMEWNAAKFWSQPSHDKENEKELARLANKFIGIVTKAGRT